MPTYLWQPCGAKWVSTAKQPEATHHRPIDHLSKCQRQKSFCNSPKAERDGRFHPFQKFDAPQTVSEPMSRSEEYVLLNTRNILPPCHTMWGHTLELKTSGKKRDQLCELLSTATHGSPSNTSHVIPHSLLLWIIFYFSRVIIIFSRDTDE